MKRARLFKANVVVALKVLRQVFFTLETLVSCVAFAMAAGIGRLSWLILAQVSVKNVKPGEFLIALAGIRTVLLVPSVF